MRLVKALLLATALALLIGCSTDSEDPRSIAGNKYDNSAIGLSLQFPANWQLKLDHKFGDVVADLLASGPAAQGITPNVNVGLNKHSGGNVDWPATLAILRTQLPTQFPDIADYEDTLLVVDGKQFARISYTTATQGPLLKFKQDLLLNKGTQITVTYTDLASRFDQNTDFPGIAASMELY